MALAARRGAARRGKGSRERGEGSDWRVLWNGVVGIEVLARKVAVDAINGGKKLELPSHPFFPLFFPLNVLGGTLGREGEDSLGIWEGWLWQTIPRSGQVLIST